MPKEVILSLFQHFHIPGTDDADYHRFFGFLDDFKRKQKVVTDYLDQVYQRHSSNKRNLLDLFENTDTNHNGYVNRADFIKVFNQFGISLDRGAVDVFFFFIDTNANGEINYRDLFIFFEKYLSSIGKDINDLFRSNYLQGTKNISFSNIARP